MEPPEDQDYYCHRHCLIFPPSLSLISYTSPILSFFLSLPFHLSLPSFSAVVWPSEGEQEACQWVHRRGGSTRDCLMSCLSPPSRPDHSSQKCITAITLQPAALYYTLSACTLLLPKGIAKCQECVWVRECLKGVCLGAVQKQHVKASAWPCVAG